MECWLGWTFYIKNTNKRYPGPRLFLKIFEKSKKLTKYQPKTKYYFHPVTNKKTVDHAVRIYFKSKYDVFSPRKHQTRPYQDTTVTISKMIWRKNHKQLHSYNTSLQFRKNYQCLLCSVAVRFSDTPSTRAIVFPVVRPVNCGISFIWIAVLGGQDA